MELILVVVIMGIVYMFAIGSLQKVKAVNENLLPTLSNLKTFLLTKQFENKARFVCFDGCSACDVLLDGRPVRQIEGFFDSEPRIYRYSPSLGMEQIQSDPYFDTNGVQKDVCFSYRVYKDGTGDQIFVEYHGKVYNYGDYFEDVTTYDSIDEATRHKESVMHKALS